MTKSSRPVPLLLRDRFKQNLFAAIVDLSGTTAADAVAYTPPALVPGKVFGVGITLDGAISASDETVTVTRKRSGASDQVVATLTLTQSGSAAGDTVVDEVDDAYDVQQGDTFEFASNGDSGTVVRGECIVTVVTD